MFSTSFAYSRSTLEIDHIGCSCTQTKKEKDHMKETSLGPLMQGQWLDTSETKLCSSKKRNPPNQSSKNHKELPLNQCNSPWTNACKTPLEQGSCNSPALTGQTGQHDRSDQCAKCEQDQHSDRSDR
jgi:hypothetical protein